MASESRYGVFGGTFDPIHLGHLQTVADVAHRAKLEKVIFIPAARPPHRGMPGAAPKHRLEMVSLAVADRPEFEVDDRELRRDRPSYTYDTVKSLQHDYPDKCLFLILGLDAFLGFESWYKWRELLDSIHFIVMRRPGWEIPHPLPRWWQNRQGNSLDDPVHGEGGAIHIMEIAPVPVSATEIRYGISTGLDVSALMPPAVWKHIRANNLYLEPLNTE